MAAPEGVRDQWIEMFHKVCFSCCIFLRSLKLEALSNHLILSVQEKRQATCHDQFGVLVWPV